MIRGSGSMRSKILAELKQYMIVIIATLIVVLLYLWCYGNREGQFLSFDRDKAIDSFIEQLILSDENGSSLNFSECEYNIQNIMIFLLCKIAGDVYQGINVYYILSFFMISIAMFWYLRKIKVSVGIAAYVAVLTSLLPFHIDRGEGQIITSTFFLVPIFAGIWNDIIYEERVEKIKKAYIIWMCIAPFADVKFSVMAMVITVILVVHRHKREITKLMLLYMSPVAIGTIVLNQVTLVLKTDNIEQSIQLARTEGMRILDMMMPLRYHVWDRLWNMRYEYDVEFAANGEAGWNSMGILLTIFFVMSMLILFFDLHVDKRITWLAWINILVILISNISGFNLLLEYIGIHVGYWNRMAIIIIVNTAAAMGIIADRLHQNMNRKVNMIIVNGILGAIGVVGMLDVLLRQNML